MRCILILFAVISIDFYMLTLEAAQCGPDQRELEDRANDFLGRSPGTQIPPISVTPRPSPPVAGNSTPSSHIPASTQASAPDPRSTGAYYYDRQNSGGQLSPREQRQANAYQNSVIETRSIPVNFNTPGVGPAQKKEISQLLDHYGIKYNKSNYTIPPSSATGGNIALEDRVRKIIYDTMKGPITDINFQMDILRDRVSNLEAILAMQNAKDQVWKKSKGNKGGKAGERMLASIPNSVPPEKAAVNPLDLDQIVNKALYVRDGTHWTKSASVTEKQSKDPISQGNIAKEIYRSYAIPDGTEIRVLELVNTKDEIVGIKIFIYRPDKNTWVPVFYKPDPTTQQFVRQTTYHGDRLPYACINCHGGTLRKMSPEVEMSYWKKTSKK